MTEYASDLSDFKDLLRAVADSKRQRAAIIEKDYYLCRALHALSAGHTGEFILKGGTSLSKGWNLLDRFSEDLDILVRSEGAYNSRSAKAKGYMSFDAKNLRFGGGQSQLEFCDILHLASRTLYFAKIASRSSGMSHLLEQVRRTAELLFSQDQSYRDELIAIIKKHHKGLDTKWLTSRPRQGDWNLCLVSLGKAKEKLPFFARCGLAKLYKDLREQGHVVPEGVTLVKHSKTVA